MGRPLPGPEEGRGVQDLLRRARRHRQEERRRDHRAVDPPAGPAGRGPPGLRRAVRRLRSAGGARQPRRAHRLGGRAGQAGADRQQEPRPHRRMPSFTGALLWHTFYPWPQRPAGLVEEGFAELARRWKPILDHADCVRRRRGVGSAPRRGRARRRDLRAVPQAPERPQAREHPLRPVAPDPAGHGLQRLHRPLPHAHQELPRQGRGVPPRMAAPARTAATSAGRSAPAASARSATGRSTSAASSASSPSTATRAGRCWSGSAR